MLAYLYIERGVCGLGVCMWVGGVVYVIVCVNGRGVDEKKVDKLIDRQMMVCYFLVFILIFFFSYFYIGTPN